MLDYEENIRLISRFLSRQGEYGYGFAVVLNEGEKDLIQEEIYKLVDFQGVPLKIVQLNTGNQSLLNQLFPAGEASPAHALIINGLSDYLAVRGREGLSEVNHLRESLNHANRAMLFWVDTITLQEIALKAGDLFSQRRFSTAIFEEKRTADTLPAFNPKEFSDLIKPQLNALQEQRKTFLENKIEEFRQLSALDMAQKASTTYQEVFIPLVTLYLEINEPGNAAEILFELASRKLISKGKPSQLLQLAEMMIRVEKYQEALPLLKTAWKQKKIGAREVIFGRVARKMGDVYLQLDNQVQAIQYFKKSLVIFESINRSNPHWIDIQVEMSKIHNQLGDLFKAKKKNDLATTHYQHGLRIREDIARIDQELSN